MIELKTTLRIVVVSVLATLICCCSQRIDIPTEPALGCEHVSLDKVLPGIGADITSVHSRREHYRNDKQLIPGQKVGDFTLLDFNGEEVSLSDVLKENDTVLVDFWASWCAPCVASFPKFKELRDKYKHQGFEIVSISIDRTREDWEGGTEEHELPWINLGELESWHGEVAVMYGVRFIPKSYLIDKERCLVQKDLPSHLLEEVLADQYDELSS